MCLNSFQIWTCVTEDLMKKFTSSPPDVEALRVFLILPLYHEFNNPKQHPVLHKQFANAVLKLKQNASRVVGSWWTLTSTDYFERLVTLFKNVVTFVVRNQKIPENKVFRFAMTNIVVKDGIFF